MYLYINKDIILKKEQIISVLNIESIKETNEYKTILENIQINDISNGAQKTLIIYKKEKNIKGVITNISSNSILKRNNKND